MHRNTNRSRLVGDSSRNRLANPPRRVRGELIAAFILELVHSLHETNIAFLDQVQELKTTICVLLGDADYQP